VGFGIGEDGGQKFTDIGQPFDDICILLLLGVLVLIEIDEFNGIVLWTSAVISNEERRTDKLNATELP
jgi:hypothetical protein